MIWHRRRLLVSPTRTNEYNYLELPRARKSLDSSRSLLFGKRKAQGAVFNGNSFEVTKIGEVEKKLGYDNCFVVDLVGRSEGLAILWKLEVEVEVFNYSLRHISVWVYDAKVKTKWLLTSFYGYLDLSKRNESWDLLKRLKPTNKAWYVVGDFNEILF